MAWTTPLTAVANAVLTSAQWNASVKNNLAETAVAKATAAGGYYVGTNVNSLAQRVPDEIEEIGSDTTSSTTYVSTLVLGETGPTITASTGPYALLIMTSDIANTTASQSGRMCQAISGASTVASDDRRALRVTVGAAGLNVRASLTSVLFVTAGSNTFTAQYRASGGTAQFAQRRFGLLPF